MQLSPLFCLGMILGTFSAGLARGKDNATPYEMQEFERLGVVKAWEKYKNRLSWGKGQCLAILDDGCDLNVPEWKVQLPWGKKVLATYNSIDQNEDPSPVPPGYHGTSVGYPSSLNYEGRHGVAFNNQVAQVRAVSVVHLRKDESQTLARALEWVLENREKYGITAVNLSALDDQEHTAPMPTLIDEPLKKLREAGVWVSAPCGNNNFVKGISWPASAEYCFAIGATNPYTGKPHLDRFSNVDILAPAVATSSSNATMAACAMVLREAIEKKSYDWKKEGKTLPDAMMAIFQKTGKEVLDEETGLKFREANLLDALDYVYAGGKLRVKSRSVSEVPKRAFTGREIYESGEWTAQDFAGRSSLEFAQVEGDGLLLKTDLPQENASYFLPLPDLAMDDRIEVSAKVDVRSGIHRMRVVLSTGQEYQINLYVSGEIGTYGKGGYETIKTPENVISEVTMILDAAHRPKMQVFANGGDEPLLSFEPPDLATQGDTPGLFIGEYAGEYDGECLWENVSVAVSRPGAAPL